MADCNVILAVCDTLIIQSFQHLTVFSMCRTQWLRLHNHGNGTVTRCRGHQYITLKMNPKIQARRCSDPPVPTQEVDPDDADNDKDIDPDTAVPSSNDKEDP